MIAMVASIKSIGLIISVICLILIHSTDQQIVTNENYCLTKMNSSLTTCQGNLENRLDLSHKPDDFEISGSHCCYLAEFTHCVETLTQEKCSKQLNDLYSSGNFSITTKMINRCKNYSLYLLTSKTYVELLNAVRLALLLALQIWTVNLDDQLVYFETIHLNELSNFLYLKYPKQGHLIISVDLDSSKYSFAFNLESIIGGVTCTLIIHITYIIAAAVILGAIAVVCCVIGYRRWHMLRMEAKQSVNPFNKY